VAAPAAAGLAGRVGRERPIFVAPGAEAFRQDVPDATVVLLDTGHFALEEDVDVISQHIDELMAKAFA
jgi:hypothetical protein